METLEHRTPLHLPTLHTFEEDGINYAVDPAEPNWIAVDEKGRELLDAIAGSGGEVTFGALVAPGLPTWHAEHWSFLPSLLT